MPHNNIEDVLKELFLGKEISPQALESTVARSTGTASGLGVVGQDNAPQASVAPIMGSQDTFPKPVALRSVLEPAASAPGALTEKGLRETKQKLSTELINAFSGVGVKLDPKKSYARQELDDFIKIAEIKVKAKTDKPPSPKDKSAILNQLENRIRTRFITEIAPLERVAMQPEAVKLSLQTIRQEEIQKLIQSSPELAQMFAGQDTEKKYTSADQVKSDYKQGVITKEKALEILRKQFFKPK